MEGEKIKDFLRKKGITVAEVARRLGTSQQNLSAALALDNVKTTTVEDIARVIDESPTAFYTGESSGTAVVNGGTVNGDVTGKKDEDGPAVEAIIAQLGVKDRQLGDKDQQIDRLLRIIERMQQ